jgi:hypothetical protein
MLCPIVPLSAFKSFLRLVFVFCRGSVLIILFITIKYSYSYSYSNSAGIGCKGRAGQGRARQGRADHGTAGAKDKEGAVAESPFTEFTAQCVAAFQARGSHTLSQNYQECTGSRYIYDADTLTSSTSRPPVGLARKGARAARKMSSGWRCRSSQQRASNRPGNEGLYERGYKRGYMYSKRDRKQLNGVLRIKC